jgi:sigma-B regulation protein RsbU (phosphoserine phosphatase)
VAAQVAPVLVEERLRAIQSITDVALSRLDDQDLLAELLERTREALQADTAAVLLLDYPAEVLTRLDCLPGPGTGPGPGIRAPQDRT